MNIFELIVLSFSLSMDSFATSLCRGIEYRSDLYKNTFITCIWFSIFQTLMPVLGFMLGTIISSSLFKFAYIISFLILLILGINMISDNDDDFIDDKMGIKVMILLSLSISMDAFSVGISYSLLNLNIVLPSIFNFSITFVTTYIGCLLGYKIGNKYSKKAKVLGGIILISLAVKIFLTHLTFS